MTTSRIAKWIRESFNGPAKERQVKCPNCDGKGKYMSYRNYNQTGSAYTAICGKCDGTGWATEWYWDD
jgi:DnaJ-class molecular chaperone